jgi:hypothetical protein
MKTPSTQKEGAKELVERARAGDQVARAIIGMTGENARSGHPVAKKGYTYILDYIKKNPIKSIKTRYGIGVEGMKALSEIEAQPSDERLLDVLCSLPVIGDHIVIQGACTLLGNGPAWTKERVIEIKKPLGDKEANLFQYGYAFGSEARKIRPVAKQLPKEAIGYLCAGHCIGSARKMQLAKNPQVPIGILSKEIGWELGSPCV